jgi:acyl-CoA reductase-like NAD-dependent aldehyde dehydrogenase
VILHEQIADAALERFVERTKALVHADPFDPDAFVSPLIDAEAADRIERWIGDAVDHGAAVRTGGGRAGNVIEPTVLTGVSRETPLGCEEAFGPVAVVSTEGSLDAAIASANRTRYGIHAGVFSNDAASLRRACEGLDVAGVAINDVPTLRLDAEPYGGIRESGVGREGPAFALAEMTEIKSFTTKTLPG